MAEVMMTPRAQSVLDHHRLERTPDGWRATCDYSGTDPQTGRAWRRCVTIEGPDRAVVVRQARCEWAHFNFEDECRAFDTIFPRNGG